MHARKGRHFMKIKTKLVISFCIILFVPIVLSCVAVFGFQTIQVKTIEKAYGIHDAGAYSLTNSIQLLNRMTESDFASAQRIALVTPAKLLDESYLDKLNEQLEDKFSYIIVRNEDDEIIYNGGTDTDKLIESLPRYGETDVNSNISTYLDGDQEILIKQLDFKCDGRCNSLYIITSTVNLVPEIKKLIVDALVAIFLILILTVRGQVQRGGSLQLR